MLRRRSMLVVLRRGRSTCCWCGRRCNNRGRRCCVCVSTRIGWRCRRRCCCRIDMSAVCTAAAIFVRGTKREAGKCLTHGPLTFDRWRFLWRCFRRLLMLHRRREILRLRPMLWLNVTVIFGRRRRRLPYDGSSWWWTRSCRCVNDRIVTVWGWHNSGLHVSLGDGACLAPRQRYRWWRRRCCWCWQWWSLLLLMSLSRCQWPNVGSRAIVLLLVVLLLAADVAANVNRYRRAPLSDWPHTHMRERDYLRVTK